MRRLTPGRILLALVGLALLVFLGWKIALALRSDETRVKLVLADVERYARERDAGAVNEYLDPDFVSPGGITAHQAGRIIWAYFRESRSVEAEITPVSPVTVEGDIATVRVRARAAVHMGARTIRLRDAGYRGDTFEVELKRHKSYFRCLRIRRVDPDEAAPSESNEQ
ncbi:MAG: hypothetical protein ACYSU0_21445 [Planctomycetota bacterium]|jgi:hypothetical protein